MAAAPTTTRRMLDLLADKAGGPVSEGPCIGQNAFDGELRKAHAATGEQISMSVPSGARTYETTCPHGLTVGTDSSAAPS